MTTDQADLINKKYKDMEAELNALKLTIKNQRDTIVQQKVIIKTQIDTIREKEIIIKTQLDTIIRYNEKVIYVKNDKDSLAFEYSSLTDSLWKWALGPTLLYTEFPDDTSIYLIDLSQHYMSIDDFGVFMPRMSNKEYVKYQRFVIEYGLPASVEWKFRNNYRIRRYKHTSKSPLIHTPRKYKHIWNQKIETKK
jgi:hypothetical protein